MPTRPRNPKGQGKDDSQQAELKGKENMENERCSNCQGQRYRYILSEALMVNTHLQGERGISPPLQDHYGRYSVTGMAADVFTAALWVWAEGKWTYFHPEWFYNQSLIRDPETGRFRREWKTDEERLQALESLAGKGFHTGCPEEISSLLGVRGDAWVPYLEIRREALSKEQAKMTGPRATHLDQLDFAAASILLRKVPELLEECSCGEREALLHMELEPGDIIEHTGDPGDRLEQNDLVLVGMLIKPALMGEGDTAQMIRSRDALRKATDLGAGEEADPATRGYRLTGLARELRKPAEECRREHRRFLRQGGWLRPENYGVLEDANLRYNAARTTAMARHGIAENGENRR